MKTISTPAPEHRCLLPGHFAGLPSTAFDQHYEPVGTVIECEDCGRRYRSEPWPDVLYGMQRVGNRWVDVYRSPWSRWKWRRDARKAAMAIEINESDENAGPAESLTSSPAGDDGSRLITDARLYSWGPVMNSPWPIDRVASTDTSTPGSS